MADDEADTIPDKLSCGGHSLFGVAEIIDSYQPDCLAKHTARGVDIIDCPFGASLRLLADPGEPTRHCGCDPDENFRVRG
jgi:hypothetical protein